MKKKSFELAFQNLATKVHVLKCHTLFFNEIELNNKRFEIRLNDRDYKEGEILDLRDFAPISRRFTGRRVLRRVTYLLKEGKFGLKPGYCSMSIEPLESELEKEIEMEQARWQEAIYELLLKHAPDHKIDGAGCDSGDPLDFTLAEISQALGHLAEQLDKAKGR